MSRLANITLTGWKECQWVKFVIVIAFKNQSFRSFDSFGFNIMSCLLNTKFDNPSDKFYIN